MEKMINFDSKINENNLQNENNKNNNINITENTNNNDCIASTLIGNDKTFNKLRELQNLIKKESALREFCKYKI